MGVNRALAWLLMAAGKRPRLKERALVTLLEAPTIAKAAEAEELVGRIEKLQTRLRELKAGPLSRRDARQ